MPYLYDTDDSVIMMKHTLNTAQHILDANRQTRGERYYPHFHLAPPAGWMNDPNGLIYHNGIYHAFYQHHPFNEHWGPMHWGHATSPDMVHWTHQPIALAPGDSWDKDGCFSGSAVDDNGRLALIYTGHVWLDGVGNDSAIREVQCLATSLDGITFQKQGIILTPPPGIMHFRDPKVWREDGKWWMVIGARDAGNCGNVLLYRGDSLREWTLDRVLAEAETDMGYMWECPDFFPLQQAHLLVCSPQGMKADGWHYRNLFQCGYMLGHWQPGQDFIRETAFRELDHGHDFYAAQSFLAADGRRIAIGWMDMWESPMPSKQEGWSGQLTLPRVLQLNGDGSLLQTPVKELETLRGEGTSLPQMTLDNQQYLCAEHADSAEVIVRFDLQRSKAARYGLHLAEGCTLTVDRAAGRLILARQYANDALNSERSVSLSTDTTLHLQIFIDRSSVEIFVNQGETCISSRIYPAPDKRALTLFAEEGECVLMDGMIWPLTATSRFSE